MLWGSGVGGDARSEVYMGVVGLRFGLVGGEPEVKDLTLRDYISGLRFVVLRGRALVRKGRRASCGLQGKQSPLAPLPGVG